MNVESVPIVEGVGTEVLLAALLLSLILLPLAWFLFRRRNAHFEPVHPALQSNFPIYQAQQNDAFDLQQPSVERIYDTDTCAICLHHLRFAVLTNCGHKFCGNCIITYWQTRNWIQGNVDCPVCRTSVSLLLESFTEADPNETGRQQLLDQIRDYNRRFSGLPRPWMDYIRDIPVLLPHLASRFFSLSGLMLMFRVRIAMCAVIAVVYLLSPLDIIPEALFGVIGIIDDLFVVLLFAVYISIAYRRFVSGEE